jgi:hypothetical protein
MGYGRGRRLLIPVFVLGLVALSAASATAIPIPSLPPPLLTPTFVGAAATANPIASTPVPQNPFMAPNGRNNIHHDAYATDAYTGPGPLGRKPVVTSELYGVEECATLAFDAAGRIVGLCGNLGGPVLRLIDPQTLNVLATHSLPARQLKLGTSPLSDLCGGAYFYLDNQDRAVVETTARTIEVVAHTSSAFTLERAYDLSAAVPSDDCLIALSPDWNGLIWFESQHGIIGTVEPTTGAVHTTTLAGEVIANSFAVDETGGVFIVSDHAMYRFDADPLSGVPVVSWRQPYDRGSTQKTGQLSQGSGTTPTLFGAGLVGITDNADPRMNVVVYQRGRTSGGQFVCSAPVFAPGASATENSLVAVGNSLFAENNYGYKDPTSTLLGATTSPGIARVDVTADGHCVNAWTSSETAPTSVPKASLASGLLYVYTKPKSLLVDTWYFTAIDLRTGATVYSKLAGVGPEWNNHYAAIYLGPDGSAYIATLTGLMRIRDTA